MKAAVMRAIGEPLRIEQVQVDAPAPREVLVRTAAAGVCHSDLHVLQGSLPSPLPTVLGHEPAGVVEAVGDEVRYVEPGDHVIGCLSVFCGTCEYCVGGRPNLCEGTTTIRGPDEPPRLAQDGEPIAQFAHLSAFAERMLVHENALVRIRPDVPLDRVALIGCGVTTGLGAVFNTARVRAGATVAVIGCMLGSNRFRVAMPRYVDLYRKGLLRLDEMISARLPLERVNDAFEALRRGTAARSVVVFES